MGLFDKRMDEDEDEVMGTGSWMDKYTKKESDSFSWKSCSHNPTRVITGENWSLDAADEIGARAHLSDFDVVVNCLDKSHAPILPLCFRGHVERKTKGKKQPRELLLCWKDFGVPDLKPSFWRALVKYLAANKARALVHCVGGHGRTGTAVACLLVVGCGMRAGEAVGWLRKNYCKKAVETQAQQDYVARVAEAHARAERHARERERARVMESREETL